MEESITKLIEEWDGEAVVTHFDAPTGAWFFVAIHNSSMGTPSGGTRIRVYDSPAQGLHDAMKLAEGMTRKWASIQFGFGGGKCVIAVKEKPMGEARKGLLRRYGRFLNTLNGAFGTGCDLGTTAEDMVIVAKETPYIHGIDRVTWKLMDPSPLTAYGVLAGIRAAAKQCWDSADLTGKRVLVQGVGGVGGMLARLLARNGAKILISDLNQEVAEAMAAETSGEIIAGADIYGIDCDIFAPCAIGGILNSETVPRLKCRIVAGSANNQLQQPEIADLLHQRGILWAPDYVVNAGGALSMGLFGEGTVKEEEIIPKIERLEDAVSDILSLALANGETPLEAADRRVQRVLASHRKEEFVEEPTLTFVESHQA